MRQLVADILDPASTYLLEPTSIDDVRRAMELDARFGALGLGLVDGVVAAVAERLRITRVLTIDYADFRPLRVGPRLRQALDLVPSLEAP